MLSSTLAKSNAVQKIFAVDVCQQTIELLVPPVARAVLGSKSDKIVPVVGSFDDLRLPDGVLDFAVEIDSLHHSDNLSHTLSECARVLKPGGVLLCFDRCHSNDLTNEDVEQMLSRVYTSKFLEANAYPPDVQLTRRENGEHEYRLFEWQAAFAAAGFTLDKHCEFYPRIFFRKALKGLLSLLPRSLSKSLYQTDNTTFKTTAQWIGQQFTQAFAHRESNSYLAPKRTTVFLLSKRDEDLRSTHGSQPTDTVAQSSGNIF